MKINHFSHFLIFKLYIPKTKYYGRADYRIY